VARQLFTHSPGRAGELLMAGAAGTGKSRACLEKINAVCLKYPGTRALVIRKTLVSLAGAALVTWEKQVVVEAMAAGDVSYFGGSAREPAQYRYGNGSVVVIGGLDKPEKVMSTEYDIAYVQEATELTEIDWEHITSRLRNGMMPYQQLIADCNPAEPTHWLKVRCDRGSCIMLESKHEDNPILFDELRHDGIVEYKLTERGQEYMGILDRLTGVRYARLRKGRWVAAEGAIYEDWDQSRHLVDSYKVPDEWPRYWGVDFGFVHPFVCQMWAEKPDGDLVLYREIFHTRRTVDQHASSIMDAVSRPDPNYRHPEGLPRYAHHGRIWTDVRPSVIVADHDAEGRTVLERELGMVIDAADKRVLDGIQAVQVRLREGRLTVMRNALFERDEELVQAKKPTCTVEEFPAYVWDTGGGRKIKEQPLKEDDDGMDTARYVVLARDPSMAVGVRFL
jgi:PBSX family phage terminase large subunit